jgi:hypothetical protein
MAVSAQFRHRDFASGRYHEAVRCLDASGPVRNLIPG